MLRKVLFAAPAMSLLLLHGALAAAMWSYLPRGFPAGHLRFLSNELGPALVAAASLSAFVAPWRPRLAANVLWSFAWLWAGAGVTARLLFPESLPNAAIGGLLVAVGIGAAARLLARHRSQTTPVIVALPGIVLGSLLAVAQRAPAPTTRPAGPQFDLVVRQQMGTEGLTGAGPPLQFDRAAAALRVPCGPTDLEVQPLLAFHDGSPDGMWSNLAPAAHAVLKRSYLGERAVPGGVRAEYGYHPPESAAARLEVLSDGQKHFVYAATSLVWPVYSHLNHFSRFELRTRERVELTFSSSPRERIEVRPFDYPVGRPARFAYLQHDGTMRVVQAASGEKGPFLTLAEGRLDGPLAIDVLIGGLPACRITLASFASQAGTELSPAAGWGVPQNAIEFARSGTGVWISASLAATSVGRGWDTVGHRAGTYQNRLIVEPVAGNQSGPDVIHR